MLQIINLDPECSTDERAPALTNQLQTSQLCSSVIYGSNVSVNLKPRTHTSGSSLVTTKNISNYAWPAEKMPGSLIAIHCSGRFIAYGIKAPNEKGMVRIIRCGPGVTARGLIKDIDGVIRDVSFAYLTEQIFVSCVDGFGSLFVHEIIEEEGSLRTELKLKVTDLGPDSKRAIFWRESSLQRVVWCPYIPEDFSDDELDEDNCALMLTVTNGSAAEVWHLGLVQEHSNSPVIEHEVKVGYHMITDNTGAIIDAAFSPDGTALATASMDGSIKFFQMNFDDSGTPPRCLHQWNPHDSQPVSCLFFLDNYKHPNVDALWKYAVTGANNNTELKVWSCQNWKCHQTINFKLCVDSIKDESMNLNFKASIDPTSKYIILSDTERRVLFILILNQDDLSSRSDEMECEVVKFISISEIAIQMGALSLAVNNANFKLYKQWNDDDDFNTDEGDDENDIMIVEGLVMQCFLINQISLQEAVIKFQPCLPIEGLKKTPDRIDINSSGDETFSLRDGLTDLSLTLTGSTFDQTMNISREEQSTISFQDIMDSAAINENDSLSPPPAEAVLLSLLTPESFNTKTKEESEMLDEIGMHSKEDDCELPTQSSGSSALLQPMDSKGITASSSTSSPSLEVQQILHNGKIDEFIDAEEGSAEDENVKSLVDILGNFSINKNMPMENVWPSDQPLLLNPSGLSLLTPDSISGPKDILTHQSSTDEMTSENSMQVLPDSNLLKSIVIDCSSHPSSEMDPAPQLSGDSSEDSQSGLANFKDLQPMSKQITCEQLEAYIKSETPISKPDSKFIRDDKAQNGDLPHTSEISSFNSSIRINFDAIQSDLSCIKESLSNPNPKMNKQNLQQMNKLDSALDKLNKHCKTLQTIAKQVEDSKKNMDKFLESVPNLVVFNIKNGIENTIKKEIKNSIFQATNKSIDSLRTGMQSELRNVLVNINRQIVDQVSRIAHSKQFKDNICSGVNSSLSNSISESVKEYNNRVIVPSFNVSSSEIFTQMNDAFSKGTNEYLNHVKNKTNAMEAAISDNLTKSWENLAKAAAESQSQNNGIPENLETSLRIMMREEVAKALQEQSALIELQNRTQTPTSGATQSPFSVKNAQQHLQNYISRQEFNSAFKHALMLSDLSLLVFVCERVNPIQLFSHSPCPLTQEVLLSLINQLSYDLSTYTDLKIKYLEEAVLTLDMTHQVTKDNMRQVLGDCQRALTVHLAVNPNLKKLKMLLLAVNQLLSSA